MRKRYDFIESEAAREVRLREAQLMRDAAAEQDGCRRCGGPLDDADDAVCAQCQYNDLQSQEDNEWHDEHDWRDYDEDEREDGDAL